LRYHIVFRDALSDRYVGSLVHEGETADMVGGHCLAGLYAAVPNEDPRRLAAFMLRLCRTLFYQPVPAESRAF
jgi:hypothetical protein